METTRLFNLNGRQLLYTKRNTGFNNQDCEKKLSEIPQGRNFALKVGITPMITVKKENNGQKYIYNNRYSLESVTANKNSISNYTVSVPTKNGDNIIGYIKDEEAIAWTKNKAHKRLLKKIATIIKSGF